MLIVNFRRKIATFVKAAVLWQFPGKVSDWESEQKIIYEHVSIILSTYFSNFETICQQPSTEVLSMFFLLNFDENVLKGFCRLT